MNKSGNIKTLGELAEVFQELKDEGVSRGSMEYVTEKVFFDQETTIPRQQAPSNIGKNEYTQLLIGSNEEGWRVRLMDNGGLEIFAPWGARDMLVKPRASNLIELEGRRA